MLVIPPCKWGNDMRQSNSILQHGSTRRAIIAGGLAAAGGAALLPARGALAQPAQEPKSIHTWLGLGHREIYNIDINLRIDWLPTPLDSRWLYFPSLQVNFDRYDEWAHGGVQWAGGARKVNWGGGSVTGYGKSYDGREMRILNTFQWYVGNWYRYRVWRVAKDETGYNRWLFTMYDYTTRQEHRIGTLRTRSDWITGAVVWIETGYGVVCDTQPVRISWHNPIYRCSTPGVFTPTSGTADYNGTCVGVANTNQWMLSSNPPYWQQQTNTPRSTRPGTRLWG